MLFLPAKKQTATLVQVRVENTFNTGLTLTMTENNTTWDWRRQREKPDFLVLEDGSVFRGYSVGFRQDRVGELVFNTGMTGYQEILTDPSYSGQIVVMTNPEIGNTGMNHEDPESAGLFLEGFIVHQLNQPSNWRSIGTVMEYLQNNRIPALAGIDTRALTLKLRDYGTMRGYISVEGKINEAGAAAKAREWPGLDGIDLACQVTTKEGFEWDTDGTKTISWGVAENLPEADLTVAAYDFGIKWNLARRLRQLGIKVKIVPATASAEDILELGPDGLFLSNGPADPAAVTYAVDNLRRLIGRLPIMGVCMGHQLIALALGAKTYRLKFGHHGCNHPVKDLRTGKVEITSQNHNFCVDGDSLPEGAEVSHHNLNDNTVEGIENKSDRLFSVQYHPEAAPGPRESQYLFSRFKENMKSGSI